MAQIPAAYWAPSIAVSAPTNPVAPSSASATFKMQGLSGLITPLTPTANVLALLQATLTDNATTVGIGVVLQMYYGPVISGVAIPVNAGSVPASAIALGQQVEYATGVTLTTAADLFLPVTMFGMAKGLTPGQQYWFDIGAYSVITASACALTNVNLALLEI